MKNKLVKLTEIDNLMPFSNLSRLNHKAFNLFSAISAILLISLYSEVLLSNPIMKFFVRPYVILSLNLKEYEINVQRLPTF